MICGLELNPGPNSLNGGASAYSTCASGKNSKIRRSVQRSSLRQCSRFFSECNLALSSCIDRIQKRLESSGFALTAKIQNVQEKLDAQLSKLYDSQETLFNDVDENYQDLQRGRQHLQALVEKLESKIDSVENQSRRNTLIFELPLDRSET